MLQSRRRRRYGSYAIAAPNPLSEGRRKAMPLLFVAFFIVIGIWLFLRFLTPGAEMRRAATMLSTDGRGQVEFIIEGNDTPQRAETGLELYEGERIRTDGAAHASLQFFDGTVIILDQGTSILMGEALQGQEESRLELTLESGRIFVKTGTSATVSRTIETVFATHDIPARATALIGGDAGNPDTNEKVTVFQTTGQGIASSVRVSKQRMSVITGEGQELFLSASGISQISADGKDPYTLRRVLDPMVLSTQFYRYATEAKEENPLPEGSAGSSSSGEATVDGQQLTVDEPKDGTLLDAEAVIVKGRVGSRVVTVRVNGYSADVSEGAYQKEIALPAEENFAVEVQAEDRDGLIIEVKSLSLRRDIKPPEPPIITSPARRTIEDTKAVPAPEPVAVQENEFEVTGEAPGDAVGVIVNGYRLQKFVPGKPWAYLVDGNLGNVRVGENTYEVVSVDRSGNLSEPVRIVILWRAEAAPLPDNGGTPDDRTSLFPGSLRVIAPTHSTSSGQASGSPYETSEAEVLIEGETHPDTATISVNGYALSLYLAGKVTWNYIAKEEYGNYRAGTNTYTVVARNSDGKILDVVRYVIEKR